MPNDKLPLVFHWKNIFLLFVFEIKNNFLSIRISLTVLFTSTEHEETEADLAWTNLKVFSEDKGAEQNGEWYRLFPQDEILFVVLFKRLIFLRIAFVLSCKLSDILKLYMLGVSMKWIPSTNCIKQSDTKSRKCNFLYVVKKPSCLSFYQNHI